MRSNPFSKVDSDSYKIKPTAAVASVDINFEMGALFANLVIGMEQYSDFDVKIDIPKRSDHGVSVIVKCGLKNGVSEQSTVSNALVIGRLYFDLREKADYIVHSKHSNSRPLNFYKCQINNYLFPDSRTAEIMLFNVLFELGGSFFMDEFNRIADPLLKALVVDDSAQRLAEKVEYARSVALNRSGMKALPPSESPESKSSSGKKSTKETDEKMFDELADDETVRGSAKKLKTS